MKTAKVTNRRAFTLIELLVVIAILALLLSVLMPSIAEAKRLAVGVKCLSNLRQIGLMTHNYFAENNDWIPFAYHMTETNYSHYSTPSAPGWCFAIALYGGIEPFSFHKFTDTMEQGFGADFIFLCPATIDLVTLPSYRPVTYAPNTYIASRAPQEVNNQRRGKLDQIDGPADKVWINDTHKDAWAVFTPNGAKSLSDRFVDSFTRHRGDTANTLYFDGHAQPFALVDAVEVMDQKTPQDPWWPWRKGEALPQP
jgi:prepilin-type N-terminal cleavage/methylation domain-containing protein/prepilin-type processing-associated H-X9-DG protein